MMAGSLRHELTIRSRSTASDGYGGKGTATVTDAATVWGSITPIHAQEFQGSQQRSSTREYEVHLRYDANLALTMQHELYNPRTGSTYRIVSLVDVDERQREWELVCTEDLTT